MFERGKPEKNILTRWHMFADNVAPSRAAAGKLRICVGGSSTSLPWSKQTQLKNHALPKGTPTTNHDEKDKKVVKVIKRMTPHV